MIFFGDEADVTKIAEEVIDAFDVHILFEIKSQNRRIDHLGLLYPQIGIDPFHTRIRRMNCTFDWFVLLGMR